ncbi:hypothetical protein B4084_0439 [Bacillus cereus]|nr:hypothetical protein B4084_0439 [Bacillus cereus]
MYSSLSLLFRYFLQFITFRFQTNPIFLFYIAGISTSIV